MLLRHAGFQGRIPRLHKRMLPETHAQTAHNVRLDDGILTPINETAAEHTLASAAGTIRKHQGSWRGWPGEVYAAPGPVAADRLYIMGDGAPQFEESGNTWPLALPAPVDAPECAILRGTYFRVKFIVAGDTVVWDNHGLSVGTQVSFNEISAPCGVSEGTIYYVAEVVDANTITIASSLGGSKVSITGNATGNGNRSSEGRNPSGDRTVEEVVYVYTYVTELGEESAPSPPSDAITVYENDVVRVSGFSPFPSGRNIHRLRIYCSQTSLSGDTSFYFVAELPYQGSGDHNPRLFPLQELLQTIDYDTPPDDLTGLVSMPNGLMAAFRERELYFCEPFQPHAWPKKYMLTTDDKIVALAMLGSVLFVLTEGRPYVVQGYHPDNFGMEQMDADLPCLSARGVVDLGYAVVYPSTDGLVRLTQSGSGVATESIFTRRAWEALGPDTFRATNYAGRYLFSHTPVGGSTQIGFIDLRGDRPFYATADGAAAAFWREPTTGKVFMVDASATTQILEWDAGAPRTLVWRSKLHFLPTLTNFGCLLVDGEEADGMTFETRVYAGGELRHTETTMNSVERLPAGFLSTQWEVEVETDRPVSAVTLAGHPAEIWGG